MPLRVRIAGHLIAAGSFGPAAADQPDTVKAVPPGGVGVLTNVAVGSWPLPAGLIATSACHPGSLLAIRSPSHLAVTPKNSGSPLTGAPSRCPTISSMQRYYEDGDNDGGRHYPELVGHANGGNHAIEREHDVEQQDLRDDAAKARANPGRLLVRHTTFQPMVDLAHAPCRAERSRPYQNEIPLGNGMAEDFEQRLGEPDNQGD
jgi:hypothetical protein